MERLTQRIDGIEGAILASDMEEKYTAEELIDILLARVAAYEDTGYEPYEIRPIAAMVKDLQKEAAPLIRAKNEGRLVEHPCKVGDIVWAIDWCSKLQKGYSCPYSCSAGQRDRVFRKNCIQYCRIFKTTYMQSMLGEIGNRVFLTRESAQRRLKEKAGIKEE